jgi:four helix bundle protein
VILDNLGLIPERGNKMDSGGVKTFRDLLVWQKAMNLVTETYKVTRSFPKEEWYGLVQQIRRCAVSIPSNIAEGYGRKATNDYIRFLQISIGSLFELQTQLEISLNLEYIRKDAFVILFESTREVERMLVTLINKLQKPEK